MRFTFCLFAFFFSLNLWANPYVSKIEDIDYPDQMSDDVLVFLSTGQVAKISEHYLQQLKLIHEAKFNKSWLKITLNNQREIIGIEAVDAPPVNPTTYSSTNEENLMSINYEPTVLRNTQWARKFFFESKMKHKESQCFNRAHAWSYDWYKTRKINSNKIFIFFTRKFIRERQFPWWFHVAPLVHVAMGTQIKERVMDMKYMKGPSTVGRWIKEFVKTSNTCTTVDIYSDYANYPENGDCYIMRTSMYYYWPLDLENLELHGTVRTTWNEEELKIAYEEAFDIIK